MEVLLYMEKRLFILELNEATPFRSAHDEGA